MEVPDSSKIEGKTARDMLARGKPTRTRLLVYPTAAGGDAA